MIRKTSRRLIVFFLGISIMLCATVAFSAEPIKLRYAHPFPASFPFADAEQWFVDQINARTNGQVNIKIFWAGSLGKPQALPGLLRSGGVDIATIVPGYYPSEFPLGVGPNNIFHVNNNIEEALLVAQDLYFKGPMNDELTKQKMKPLFVAVLNPYDLWTRKPVTSLSQMKGMKIRTWGPFLPKMCEAVGAIGVEMVVTEWFEGMERGAVDGGLFGSDQAIGMKVPDVAKYCTVTSYGVTSGPFIAMNTDKWNSLPPKIKAVFEEVMKEMPAKMLEVQHFKYIHTLAKMKKLGVNIVSFKENERDQWIEKTPSFVNMWLDDLKKKGLEKEGAACWDRWKALLADYRVNPEKYMNIHSFRSIMETQK